MTSPITFKVDNISVTPTFVGLTSAGLYQLNFTVPSGSFSGDVPVQIGEDGLTTPSGDVITVNLTLN